MLNVWLIDMCEKHWTFIGTFTMQVELVTTREIDAGFKMNIGLETKHYCVLPYIQARRC